ncbi:MAG: alcohol dehydrogenase catalytic domain-containing protein [Chloroflexi bacterium]|nr:alcohol dehydrogenase catalytic domain-containing protein [Chloroflexota bacterium]
MTTETCVRFAEVGRLQLGERDVPRPGPGEVRVAPLAVGICGTDARILEGAYGARPGTILGHEIAGLVAELGPGVDGLAEGDHVSIEPHLYCGTCRYCRLGWEHLCPSKRAFGVHLDGGMAGSVVVPARLAYRVPAGVDPVVACMAEPVGCGIHGMDRLQPMSGLPLCIIGSGPAGLMLLALARLTGVGPIVVLEPDAARREAALLGGADHVLDPTDEGWRDAAMAATGGHGFDQLIEAAGSPTGLATAIDLAARHARILVYGVAHPDAVTPVRANDIYARELTILGAALNPYTHARAVELVGHLGLERLAPGRYPLPAVEDAFAAQRERRHLKVVIMPNG